jgi:hypothetical protein
VNQAISATLRDARDAAAIEASVEAWWREVSRDDAPA